MVRVGPGGSGGDEGGTAAQAPADGDIRPDRNPQAGHGQAQLIHYSLIGDHGQVFRRGVIRLHALEKQPLRQLLKGEGIIQGQGQTQGIEAGT